MSLFILLAASVVACYTDVRWGKIPNALVVPFFAAGLASQFIHGPYYGFTAVAAAIVVFVGGAVAFSLGIMGGGDIKFFVAAAATLGAQDGARFIFYTLVCGGIAAIAISMSRGTLKTMLSNVQASAVTLTAPAVSGRFPYAIAMLGGAVVLAAAETILPVLRFPL